ncbi:MAG: L,D-transpeptidase [Deltaproteobacteria bacterium]|nr:L,D-transpeptidase [Deltaproteobacteria bacterium]
MKSLATFTFSAAALMFTSCAVQPEPPKDLNADWLQSGSIQLSRPAPKVKASNNSQMFSFMPVSRGILRSQSWAQIDTKSKVVRIFDGEKLVNDISIVDSPELIPGEYKVILKQENPLWYAPDTYFLARNHNVPSKGDPLRFRKGALGNQAIFISKDFAIHSAALSDPDVGGLRVSESDLVNIYKHLETGSLIEIR